MNSPDTLAATVTPIRTLAESDPRIKDLLDETKLDLAQNKGEECGHMNADESLCNLLVALGFQDVVDLYNEVSPKWYS